MALAISTISTRTLENKLPVTPREVYFDQLSTKMSELKTILSYGWRGEAFEVVSKGDLTYQEKHNDERIVFHLSLTIAKSVNLNNILLL
jgi:hypothetical protein